MPISILMSKWLMPMVKQITVNTNEIYPVAFLKDAVLNRSLKGAMSGSVGRVHLSKPFISIKKPIMISLSKIAVSTNKFISKNFSK